MSRQSLTRAHEKIKELSWEPTFATPAKKYATDYTFEHAPKKDPLKQVLRSYFPMEEEKDQRVYGAMDGAIRGNMFRQVQERWMEWQKLFLSIIPFPEISAARAMPLAISAVRPLASGELRFLPTARLAEIDIPELSSASRRLNGESCGDNECMHHGDGSDENLLRRGDETQYDRGRDFSGHSGTPKCPCRTTRPSRESIPTTTRPG